jgi:hypothetical protein
MTRENIFALLPPGKTLEECAGGRCLVELGRNVGAEYAAQGTVSKYDDMFTLTLEIYETMGSKLVGTLTAETPDPKGLLAAVRERAPAVFADVAQIAMLEDSTVTVVNMDSLAITDTTALLAPILPVLPADTIIAIHSKPTKPTKLSRTWKKWLGVGVGVTGALVLIQGKKYDREKEEHYTKYKVISQYGRQWELDDAWERASSAQTKRNVAYTTGALLMAGGWYFYLFF